LGAISSSLLMGRNILTASRCGGFLMSLAGFFPVFFFSLLYFGLFHFPGLLPQVAPLPVRWRTTKSFLVFLIFDWLSFSGFEVFGLVLDPVVTLLCCFFVDLMASPFLFFQNLCVPVPLRACSRLF